MKKRGRPFTYPEFLIRMLLFIKCALRLPYRQMEGIGAVVLVRKSAKIRRNAIRDAVVRELGMVGGGSWRAFFGIQARV